MDASRYNSPSRKSRFRSQSGAPYRPAAPAEEPPAPEGEDEQAPVYAGEETDTEAVPLEAETETADPLATGYLPVNEPSTATIPDAEVPPPDDGLPAGLRLTRSADSMRVQSRGVSGWMAGLLALTCLVVGGGAGYLVRANGAATHAAAVAGSAAAERTAPVLPLTPAVLSDVDAAFGANKAGQFADARRRFDALADQHPNWPSMRIEAARTTLYEHDFEAAGAILAGVERAGANVDAAFLNGLLQMTMQAYDKSEEAFARAVAIDPARPDIFYFWGECLRREGKPQDAAQKFHEALVRNQYETTEGLYQLKLWLSEIQADQESAKDTNAKIDADLVSGHPSGPALFAAAAREIEEPAT